jgi:hypothetical protein
MTDPTEYQPRSPERARMALQRYLAGVPLAEIAAELGVTTAGRAWQVVVQGARSAGIDPPRRHQIVSDETRARAVELLRAGVPRRAIGAELGLSNGVLHRIRVAELGPAEAAAPATKKRRRR